MSDETGKRGKGRPRSNTPFIETAGGYVRWKRIPPKDLRVLVDAWIYRFPPGTDDETIRQTSEVLTRHYDQVIEKMRATMKSLRRGTK